MSVSGERRFAGIDGGATKTLCVVVSGDGRILGFGRAGPSNFHNVGVSVAVKNLGHALSSACAKAGTRRTQLSAACFGLAGLDSPADGRILRRAISASKFAPSDLVVHDSRMAIAGALAGRPGVVVNAGTGSVAGGVNSRGKYVRAGGWGNVIGDEGSAYEIGRRALKASMQSYDGRRHHTELLPLVMKRLRCDSAEEIIERVYVKKMSVTQIAALCSIVARAARKGDEAALEIIDEEGSQLARMAVTVAIRLGLDDGPYPVATVGSVFSSGAVLESFKAHLRRLSVNASVVSPALPQVLGAAMLAMMSSGVKITPKLISVLTSSTKLLPRSLGSAHLPDSPTR